MSHSQHQGKRAISLRCNDEKMKQITSSISLRIFIQIHDLKRSEHCHWCRNSLFLSNMSGWQKQVISVTSVHSLGNKSAFVSTLKVVLFAQHTIIKSSNRTKHCLESQLHSLEGILKSHDSLSRNHECGRVVGFGESRVTGSTCSRMTSEVQITTLASSGIPKAHVNLQL